MKKILLSASILMMAATSYAATDGQIYETKDGIKCESVWILDLLHTPDAFAQTPLKGSATQPSAATDGKKIYVGDSANGQIHIFDLATGAFEKSLNVTKDGEAYVTTLGLNSVGFDEYGHFWVATFVANSDGAASYPLFLCDLETGALTSVGDLSAMGGIGRIDYCDVIGDLTGKEANATVMAVSSAQDNTNIFNWKLTQGTTEWAGGWDDGLPFRAVTETYPAQQTGFSYGSVLRMVRDGSKTGDMSMFYVDGFTTFPALYDASGSMLDSFKNVDIITTDKETGVTTGSVTAPAGGTNGVAEANLGGKNLIIYSEGQHDAPHSNQIIVTTVDETLAFSSMKQLWTLPGDDGLGHEAAGGRRYHAIFTVAQPQNADGTSSLLLLDYKGGNGMAVYKLTNTAQSGVAEAVADAATITVNGGVITVSAPAETIAVYNLAGQKVAEAENASEVAAPANGAYIVKAVVAGTPVVKKVVL